MDFTLDDRTEDFRRRVRAFVAREILPLEEEADSYDAHENIRLPLLETLRERARAEGLWCLQLGEEYGGQGSTPSAWPPATRR